MSKELTLEIADTEVDKTQYHDVGGGGVAMVSPPVDEDYWLFRVKLSEKQAVVGFPKFFTIGIGFAQEEDWNTNLPYTCGTEEIFGHIAHNKGDDKIDDADVTKAIEMIQAAARTRMA